MLFVWVGMPLRFTAGSPVDGTLRIACAELTFHTWAIPRPSPVARRDASSLRSTPKTFSTGIMGDAWDRRGADREGS